MMKMLQNNVKTAQIQSRLNKYSYLSKSTLPGYTDARIFQILQTIKRFPNIKTNPNFYHWYIIMKQFSKNTTDKWINNQLYYDPEDTLISDFGKLYEKTLEEKEISTSTSLGDCGTQSTQNAQEQQPIIIRVMCRAASENPQQIVNKVSKYIEYGSMNLPKEKQIKNSTNPHFLQQKKYC